MSFLKIINSLRNRPNFVFWLLIFFLVVFNVCQCQTATHYSDYYIGKITANGDTYTHEKSTCASNDYPFGTILRVYFLDKWVDVRVNDRMVDNNVIDLSKSAFLLLAPLKVGRLYGIKIEIIKHPLWQEKRLRIMERDSFCCVSCKSNDIALNVHHLYYKPNTKIWEYDNEEMITICENCHDYFHNYMNKSIALISLHCFKSGLSLNGIDDILKFEIDYNKGLI